MKLVFLDIIVCIRLSDKIAFLSKAWMEKLSQLFNQILIFLVTHRTLLHHTSKLKYISLKLQGLLYL